MFLSHKYFPCRVICSNMIYNSNLKPQIIKYSFVQFNYFCYKWRQYEHRPPILMRSIFYSAIGEKKIPVNFLMTTNMLPVFVDPFPFNVAASHQNHLPVWHFSNFLRLHITLLIPLSLPPYFCGIFTFFPEKSPVS